MKATANARRNAKRGVILKSHARYMFYKTSKQVVVPRSEVATVIIYLVSCGTAEQIVYKIAGDGALSKSALGNNDTACAFCIG